jgi:hypothetical protein
MIFFDLRASYASCGIIRFSFSCIGLAYQKEAKDDTSYEQPLSDIKGNIEATILMLTVVKNLVGPRRSGQHGCRSEDIG